MTTSDVKTAITRALFMISALFLFIGYSFLPLSVPGIDASPDENANRLFSSVFADRHVLYVFEPLNQRLSEPLIAARSMRVVDDLTVPGGFIGLPMFYGALGMVTGIDMLPFFTPILAVAGVFAWGGLIGRLYGRRAGIIAAALLATHPAWWYWAGRTFMPNVPFLSLAIIGAWFTFAAPVLSAVRKIRTEPSRLALLADDALAGVAFGLALGIRLSEAYWMIVAAAVGLLATRKLPWKRLLVIGVFAMMTLAPVFMMNASLFGSMFAAGYDGAATALADGTTDRFALRILGPLTPAVFPLGFAPVRAAYNFLRFGIVLFWQWSLIVGIAAVALIAAWRVHRKAGVPDADDGRGAMRRGFLWGGLGAVLWLIALYGSWAVYDNPDRDAVTIGASYVRYWLPIFALSTVPMAFVAGGRGSTTSVRRLGAFLVAFAVASGPAFAFMAPQEGLQSLRGVLVEDRGVRDDVISRTEPDAVIIVDRADKFLYPRRRVIRPLRDERTYAMLPAISRLAPLYYFGITLPGTDLEWLNVTKLPPLGLSIAPLEEYDGNTLYVFSRIETQ